MNGAGSGTAQDGQGGTDTLVGIEGVRGSDFADTLTGSSASGEVFQGMAGNDTINGGGGTDTASYARDWNDNGDALGVVVNLSSSTASGSWQGVSYNVAAGTALDGWGDTDTLANITNLEGSIFNDVLVGNGSNNTLNGGAGNDSLDGGGWQ